MKRTETRLSLYGHFYKTYSRFSVIFLAVDIFLIDASGVRLRKK